MATMPLIRSAIHKRKTPEVGDLVFELIGKDASPFGSRQGEVKKILKHKGIKKAIVKGFNLKHKFIRPTKNYPDWCILVEAPIALSNLAVVDGEKPSGGAE